MRKLNKTDANEYIDMLVFSGRKFTLIFSGTSVKVKYNGRITKVKNDLKLIPQNELYFIKKVQKHCETLPFVKSKFNKIQYIKSGRLNLNYNYKHELYEIDLNAAYWNFAYKKGYLTPELFNTGKNVQKLTRLVALGNLAKKETIVEFNGTEYEEPSVFKSENTEGIFYDVAHETDLIMRQLMALAGFNYMFYWVDAIFVQSRETFLNICDFLNDNEIAYKVKFIHSIKKTSECVEVKDSEGTRKFNFKKSINLRHIK